MIDRVKDFLKKYNLQDKTVIVGFSGGFDSMCLLDILSKIKNDGDFSKLRVIAAHFNHNWRGEEALREQEVCRLFASSKGFEFYTRTADENAKKTELDARIARYDFFEDAADLYDAEAVLTAHNKDDNAETVLYRIIKGTGIVGLRGIAEKRGIFYRPLLKTLRSEILEYCNQYNLAPNNDSSNSDTKYKRNYLRLNVIPAIEQINPEFKDAINKLAYNAYNENEIIKEYLDKIRAEIFEGEQIITQKYKKLSTPVKLRILYDYILSLGLDYDSKKVQEIFDFVETNINQRNGSTHSLASALWLYADDKVIETLPKKNHFQDFSKQQIIIEKEGSYSFGGHILTIRKFDSDIDSNLKFPNSNESKAIVDISGVRFPFTLRTRKDGDIISPFGMQGTMKLKKYLNSKGIARHDRDRMIMLCKESEVFWAVGAGISSKIRVTNKPTHILEVK